jgi:hypothetical protein
MGKSRPCLLDDIRLQKLGTLHKYVSQKSQQSYRNKKQVQFKSKLIPVHTPAQLQICNYSVTNCLTGMHKLHKHKFGGSCFSLKMLHLLFM